MRAHTQTTANNLRGDRQEKSGNIVPYMPLTLNRYIYFISRHLPHWACPTIGLSRGKSSRPILIYYVFSLVDASSYFLFKLQIPGPFVAI
jgi:hypothetical protein